MPRHNQGSITKRPVGRPPKTPRLDQTPLPRQEDPGQVNQADIMEAITQLGAKLKGMDDNLTNFKQEVSEDLAHLGQRVTAFESDDPDDPMNVHPHREHADEAGRPEIVYDSGGAGIQALLGFGHKYRHLPGNLRTACVTVGEVLEEACKSPDFKKWFDEKYAEVFATWGFEEDAAVTPP